MRNIQKEHEPRSLTQHRCQTHANYNNFKEKQDLRDSLFSEQGGICAYCMQRIQATAAGMKIEHWQSQSPDKYPSKQLVYGNLLGVCLGGKGQKKENEHCDTSKKDKDLCKNPANPAHDVEAVIRYLGDGRIKADDEIFDREINEVLNLNHPLLVNNRKAVLRSFQESLGRAGSLGIGSIRRKIAQWSEPVGGTLEPFCMVVVYWLRKKLGKVK